MDMNSRFYFSWLLTVLFTFLVACGNGKSDSSGSTSTAKTCSVGTNILEEGQSCNINSGEQKGKYTCESGQIIPPNTTKAAGEIWTDSTGKTKVKCTEKKSN